MLPNCTEILIFLIRAATQAGPIAADGSGVRAESRWRRKLMVEFDCGSCNTTLLPSALADDPLDGDTAAGDYAPHLLTCPRCGASWVQRTTGALIKPW